MAGKKKYACSACGNSHPKPIGFACKLVQSESGSSPEQSPSRLSNPVANTGPSTSKGPDSSQDPVLAAITSLGSKLDAMERRLASTEEQLKAGKDTVSSKKDLQSAHKHEYQDTVCRLSEEEEEDLVIPSLRTIREDHLLKEQVDARLEQLKAANCRDLTGKFKSQRGGSEEVIVKKKIDWPHNNVLSGTTKARPSYDSLSVYQWVAGFGRTLLDETNVKRKNLMIEYMCDLMEDAQDFSWASAKASHAVLLCRMEEGRLEWEQTAKIDRIRRANAQKMTGNGVQYNQNPKDKGMPCRYYQSGSCSHSRDHTTGGRRYRHVCVNCMGPHPSKDCKNQKGKSKNE